MNNFIDFCNFHNRKYAQILFDSKLKHRKTYEVSVWVSEVQVE